MTLYIIIKVTKYKPGLFEHVESMSKRLEGSVYIGNVIYYLGYLPIPFSRGLKVKLEGSNIFPILMLSMHINRLGLVSHLY